MSAATAKPATPGPPGSASLAGGPPRTPPRLSNKPRAFVLVSDGQAWSGEVAKSIELAQERRIPLFVVGVGTTVGGVIPDPDDLARR